MLACLALASCATNAAAPATPALPASRITPAPGAPPRDADGDGIPDGDDRCPGDAETKNGYQDADGCPDLAQPPPAPAGGLGRIAERVGFAHDSAELRFASFPLLDALATVLNAQPEQFPLVALEGHAADNERTPMQLSLARASAVRVALIKRGVDGGRLLARASGSAAPACGQHSEACWTRERTVELATLRRTEAPATAETPPPPVQRGVDQRPPPAHAEAPAPLERVEFKKGSALLQPAALTDLDLLAGFLKANPNTMEIVGYADDGEPQPAVLAQARADVVRRYMMACGVSGKQLITRVERTGRAACRSHRAKCPARTGRAELRFADAASPAGPPAADRE